MPPGQTRRETDAGATWVHLSTCWFPISLPRVPALPVRVSEEPWFLTQKITGPILRPSSWRATNKSLQALEAWQAPCPLSYLPMVPREMPAPCPGGAGARHRLLAASLAEQQLPISQFTVPTAQRWQMPPINTAQRHWEAKMSSFPACIRQPHCLSAYPRALDWCSAHTCLRACVFI